jgi:hypothetical protein
MTAPPPGASPACTQPRDERAHGLPLTNSGRAGISGPPTGNSNYEQAPRCGGGARLRRLPRPWPRGLGRAGGSSSHSTDLGTVHRGLAVLTRNGQPYLVLLSAGGELVQVSGGPPGSGTVRLPDGRDVRWTCETRDGARGTVVIGGQSFKLENGPVYLVDLRSGPPSSSSSPSHRRCSKRGRTKSG